QRVRAVRGLDVANVFVVAHHVHGLVAAVELRRGGIDDHWADAAPGVPVWVAPALAEEGLALHVEARAKGVRVVEGGGHEQRSETALTSEVAGRRVHAQQLGADVSRDRGRPIDLIHRAPIMLIAESNAASTSAREVDGR